MLSRREKIIEILKNSEKPLTVHEIAQLLNEEVNPNELYDDIVHAAKSLYRKSGGKLTIAMIVPKCRDCGYEFKDLKRIKRPSKCPKCKSQRIEPPRFYIEEL